MRKRLLLLNAALFCIVLLFGQSSVVAQGLIIGDTSTLTINGGVLDVNCLDILVADGGTLDLQSGTLLDKNVLTVEAGGVYDRSGGTIVSCGGNSFYVIPNPNGNPVIIALPKIL
ncbi:MAG: hypothetical protein KJ804_12775 [Proteobacteria bacterium]|nr:hypothetical protein [Pseudomonadota bacterium]MBU1059179.1 hypothetical protein [Pseudomonadota bacterium]